MPQTSDNTPTAELVDQIESLQAQIDRLTDQLSESQRLATVGTIASVIAHEFNNLLTPIVSYCQLALQQIDKRKDDPELTRKALTKSLQHAARAGKISTAMLNLVRNQGETRTVAVQNLIEETLAVLARDPSKDGIALRVQVPPDLSVRGDAVQLEQVLLNLLINARQALLAQGQPRGGSISIRAERGGEENVRIFVSDSGPGIAPQNLSRIFEPFFTTKTNPRPGEARGSGLGLHLCKQIVERHGGTIDVKSKPGEGTTFSLLLPAA